MGCPYSSNQKDSLKKSNKAKRYSVQTAPSTQQTLPPPRGIQTPKPEFTERQKELVLESWKIVQDDVAKVGVIMFMKLFETHPDVQEVFMPFKGMSNEDLKHSSQLKAHALRVMGTVEKCLTRIDEPKKVEELLHDLGSRHVMYNAKVDYIDLIGPQFVSAIQPAIQERGLWSQEVEEAWSDLFKLVSHMMKAAMTF